MQRRNALDTVNQALGIVGTVQSLSRASRQRKIDEDYNQALKALQENPEAAAPEGILPMAWQAAKEKTAQAQEARTRAVVQDMTARRMKAKQTLALGNYSPQAVRSVYNELWPDGKNVQESMDPATGEILFHYGEYDKDGKFVIDKKQDPIRFKNNEEMRNSVAGIVNDDDWWIRQSHQKNITENTLQTDPESGKKGYIRDGKFVPVEGMGGTPSQWKEVWDPQQGKNILRQVSSGEQYEAARKTRGGGGGSTPTLTVAERKDLESQFYAEEGLRMSQVEGIPVVEKFNAETQQWEEASLKDVAAVNQKIKKVISAGLTYATQTGHKPYNVILSNLYAGRFKEPPPEKQPDAEGEAPMFDEEDPNYYLYPPVDSGGANQPRKKPAAKEDFRPIGRTPDGVHIAIIGKKYQAKDPGSNKWRDLKREENLFVRKMMEPEAPKAAPLADYLKSRKAPDLKELVNVR